MSKPTLLEELMKTYLQTAEMRRHSSEVIKFGDKSADLEVHTRIVKDYGKRLANLEAQIESEIRRLRGE